MGKIEANSVLADTVVNAIKEKKGEEIINLDLTALDDAVCDNFIICHGTSHPQVKAIADEIQHKVKESTGERPWYVEGYNFEEWIVLDYFDVVVHIFLKEKRYFYNLEELWGDAKITRYS